MTEHRPDLARLAGQLREAYEASPRGEKVTALHLFGIVHAAEMTELSMRDLEELATAAGLSSSFGTELRKMIRLSRHVMPREGEPPAVDAGVRLAPSVFERLARPMPVGFRFDREEANARE